MNLKELQERIQKNASAMINIYSIIPEEWGVYDYYSAIFRNRYFRLRKGDDVLIDPHHLLEDYKALHPFDRVMFLRLFIFYNVINPKSENPYSMDTKFRNIFEAYYAFTQQLEENKRKDRYYR